MSANVMYCGYWFGSCVYAKKYSAFKWTWDIVSGLPREDGGGDDVADDAGERDAALDDALDPERQSGDQDVVVLVEGGALQAAEGRVGRVGVVEQVERRRVQQHGGRGGLRRQRRRCEHLRFRLEKDNEWAFRGD